MVSAHPLGSHRFELMAKRPIDKPPREEKTEAIESCAQYLRRELGALSFERIIVVGKGCFEITGRKLNLGSDPVVVSLPFGSQRNVNDYVKGLKQYLCNRSARS